MSTLWTPGGEHDSEEPQGPAPPGDAGGPDDEAAREQLRALREQLAETPVADIVANHAIGRRSAAWRVGSAATRSLCAKRWRNCVSRSSRSAGAPSQVTTM